MNRFPSVFIIVNIFSLIPILAPVGAPPVSQQVEFPLALVDDLGHEVVLQGTPERIISLAPSNTEILYALGLEERLVAVTTLCNWPPSAQEKPKIGGMIDFNVEQVVAKDPDFVLAVRGNSAERLRRLQQLGVPVYAFDSGQLEDILKTIERLGLICGVQERADELTRSLKQRIDKLRETVRGVTPRKRVYVGSIHAPYYTAGSGSFLDEIVELAGGENIGRMAKSRWPILSAEQVLVGDPQVVFLGLSYDESLKKSLSSLRASFRQDPIWARTAAGNSGALYVLDQDSLHRPGPRLVDAAERMARALYPDRFSNVEGHGP